MGIYARQGELNITAPAANSGITSSKIDLQGGKDNIGMVATNATVNFDGEAKISGGEDQKLALAEAGGKVNLKGAVTAGGTSNFIKNSVT